jgi:CheY-like chemotaxis protein
MTEDASQTGRQIRVLLVEDALDQALLVRAMLGGGLYDVTHTQDGMHGVELFQRGEFDVVITDLNLPGMDGFDLTRELKRLRPDVPVIAATGYDAPGYTDSAYRAGVDAVLKKPLSQEQLLTNLREVLPDLHPEPERPPNVFALGARPGDVTLGAGGTVAFHRAQGHDVLIFILDSGEPDSGLDMTAARRAAERLGARVIISDPSRTDDALMERQLLLGRVVRELRPDVAYIPSIADHDPYRKEAHRLGRTVLSDTRAILAYQTGSSSLDFRPSFFKPVDRYMAQKIEALEAFYGGRNRPRELSARYVQASARYWGRMADFAEVEPFEVIKGEGPEK